MNKYALIMIITALSAVPCSARETSGSLFLGTEASAGSTWAHGTFPRYYSSDPALNASFGLTVGYGFSDSVMFIAGAGYSRKTMKLSYSDGKNSGTYSITGQFIQFRGAFRFFPVNRAYLEPGVFYGFRAGGASYSVSGYLDKTDAKYPGREMNNDYGISFGAGYVYPFGDRVSADLGVRLMYGLSEMYRDNSDFKLRSVSTVFNAGIMYRFPMQ
jgi:hypothetical protein